MGVPLTSSKVAYRNECPPVSGAATVARTEPLDTQAFYSSCLWKCYGFLFCKERTLYGVMTKFKK